VLQAIVFTFTSNITAMIHDHSDSEADLPALQQTNNDIPEETDMMNLSSDEVNPLPFQPPPRIAARFYRSANNRRKSSAASSRRNSLSSTHSHQSNRNAFRGGSQSNHVDNHLRRTSILESRKARLADRAAHAEQVRLRAALAKAAPRTSNSEERALAAQQAREKHLAQVAAACAEEVRRAKKVAEDMKERKAAEEQRYRLEMEEKLAEAERRRLEYKRNSRRPRTASVLAGEGKKKPAVEPRPSISEDDAARRIQETWRTHARQQVVQFFYNLGLSIDQVHDTSFEDISALLSDEKVLATTAKIIELFHLQGEAATADQIAVRTFLSAYLILGHPASVLSKDGDQEQDLINKAKDLIISFESALSKLSASNRYQPTPTQLETLSLAHTAFTTAFADWKARDASTLIETMVSSFVNLDAIWQSVKDDASGEVASDYREGIRDNQVILLSKIRKLAGPDRANMLIKKAISESRRSLRRRKPVGDFRPRVAVEAGESSSAVEPGQDFTQTAETASKIAEGHEPEVQRSQADEIAKMFSVVPPNRVLVHELAIDKEFRIDSAPHTEQRQLLNRSLCDSMRQGFERGEGNSWTVSMAENIRAKLLRLLKPGNSMHRLISETLDPELIHNECSRGIFSYERFFSFMASVLPKLCAPFRDARVKALAEDLQREGNLEEMIEKLFKLLEVVDLLSLDYSNFLLLNAAPTLIKESAGYEQREFAKDLDEGTITLQSTKRWWRNASVNVLTEANRRDPANRPTSQKIYARGLIDLAVATTPLQDADIPETLHLDKARLHRIRRDAVRITTIGSILLTAKSLLKRDVRSQWKVEANRMWDALKDGYTRDDGTLPTKVLSIIESAHAMPPSTRAQLSSTINRLLTQADSGRLTDPVMKVLFQRLKSHIFSRISASSSGERVRAASTASEGLATSGIPEFIGQVGEIVDTLDKIGEVDRKSHGIWYGKIAEEVEMMGADEDVPATLSTTA